METVELPIKDIRVGSRFRDDLGDISELAESIRAKGIIQPLTVTPEGKLITGERRMRAAMECGLEVVPCIVRKVSDELDFRELELFENVHRKDLTWHERAELEAEIFELKRKTEGWTQRDAAKALQTSPATVNRRLQLAQAIRVAPELKACKDEAEAHKKLARIRERAAVEELSKRHAKGQAPLAKMLAQSYLIGDALEGMRSQEPGQFNLAEVDPPYGIDLKNIKMFDAAEDYNDIPKKQYGKFTAEIAAEVYRLLDTNSWCLWWYGPTNYEVVKPALKKAGFKVRDIPGIWYKGKQGQSQQPNYHLANVYEPFFICLKGKPMLHTPGKTNVFTQSPVYAQSKIHPTERPVDLIADLLDTFGGPSSRVVSPFLGSGNTVLAAHRQHMSCLGWDIDELLKKRAVVRAEQSGVEE